MHTMEDEILEEGREQGYRDFQMMIDLTDRGIEEKEISRIVKRPLKEVRKIVTWYRRKAVSTAS